MVAYIFGGALRCVIMLLLLLYFVIMSLICMGMTCNVGKSAARSQRNVDEMGISQCLESDHPALYATPHLLSLQNLFSLVTPLWE